MALLFKINVKCWNELALPRIFELVTTRGVFLFSISFSFPGSRRPYSARESEDCDSECV